MKSMPGENIRPKASVAKFLAIAVFFSTGFCLIYLSERLVIRGATIEGVSLFRAAVGGLVVAAVLVIVDRLPFVHAFQDKTLIHTITWKSSIYIAVSLVYRYVKPLVAYLLQGVGFHTAGSMALRNFTRPTIWAIDIWVAMLLVVYVTMDELTRVIGREQMKSMFFGQRGKPAKGSGFRDAA